MDGSNTILATGWRGVLHAVHASRSKINKLKTKHLTSRIRTGTQKTQNSRDFTQHAADMKNNLDKIVHKRGASHTSRTPQQSGETQNTKMDFTHAPPKPKNTKLRGSRITQLKNKLIMREVPPPTQ